MNFRIADTFTDSLARLAGDEQKAAKTTAFDLQMNPAQPGMRLHKLDKARDKHFWSVRVSRDIRLIVHRTEESLLLCYVAHHDDAYHWAERRKLQTHPKTGAAQLVEVRERVEEIRVPQYVAAEPEAAPETAKPVLFAQVDDDRLLAYGVPEEWLADVRAANEDSLLELADHLPAEAAEALLELATGGHPQPAKPVVAGTDPFEHPDALRRFRIMADKDELEQALDFPWDKWTIFLHPAQREWVEKTYNGPARVSGSAGTGKTIVALHRAVHLVRADTEARVLLTTFSDSLADALRSKLYRLLRHQPRLAERVDVAAMDAVGRRLHRARFGRDYHVATPDEQRSLLEDVLARHSGHGFSPAFFWSEWEHVVDGWGLITWEAYRDVRRLGRRTRLPEDRRRVAWDVFADMRRVMAERQWLTLPDVFVRLADMLAGANHPPYTHAVVDEAQDINVAQLRFLGALGGRRPQALFFAGDLGQRIFRQPFSWVSLGVKVRGRSRTLHVNYRTSHQIRTCADRLLDPEVSDVDGEVESRKGTVSVFNGPVPEIRVFDDGAAEVDAVASWLVRCSGAGMTLQEIGVFVRSPDQLERAQRAASGAELPARVLGEQAVSDATEKVTISTMHRAKGLEFRAVAVMACDEEVIPSEQRIGLASDEAELEEIYETERHLLYVACTRARDRLLVTGVAPVSEFIDDLAEN